MYRSAQLLLQDLLWKQDMGFQSRPPAFMKSSVLLLWNQNEIVFLVLTICRVEARTKLNALREVWVSVSQIATRRLEKVALVTE